MQQRACVWVGVHLCTGPCVICSAVCYRESQWCRPSLLESLFACAPSSAQCCAGQQQDGPRAAAAEHLLLSCAIPGMAQTRTLYDADDGQKAKDEQLGT